MPPLDTTDTTEVRDKSTDKSDSNLSSQLFSEQVDKKISSTSDTKKSDDSSVTHLDCSADNPYGNGDDANGKGKKDVTTVQSDAQTATVADASQSKAGTDTTPAPATAPSDATAKAPQDTPPPVPAVGDTGAATPAAPSDTGAAAPPKPSDTGAAAPATPSDASPPPVAADATVAQPGDTGAGVGSWVKDKWNAVWGDKPAAPPPTDAKVDPAALTAPGSDYKGEGIKQDLPPQRDYNVGKDPDSGKPQTLEQVARQQLGDDAKADDVKKYASEIQKTNGLDNSDLKEDQVLQLPGHNKDGALITQEVDGTTKTVAQDGGVKVEHKDGTGFEYKPTTDGGYSQHHFGPKPEDNHDLTRKPDGKGGYVESHTGQRPEDNYELTRTPDGKYLVADKPGDKPVDKTQYDDAHPDPRVEQAKVSDKADAKIKDPIDRLQFHEDMDNFQQRAAKQHLTPEQQGKFYHQVDSLLAAKDNPSNPDLPKEGGRVKLAEDVMSHAGNPGGIDQGSHSTCAAAALESEMFTKSPADAARMVTEVATTGQFHTTDGKTVTPDKSILTPDSEAKEAHTADGDRSYASQIFQGTAISIECPGYRQGNPTAPHETGEKVGDASFTGLRPEQIADMNQKIAGDHNPLPIIENGTVNADVNKSDSQIHVNSEKDLQDQLKQLKDGGKLPAVMFVDTNNEPFWTDSRAGLAGGSGGGHFVTVTDFDEKTGKVSVDNQWGSRTDHKDISVRQLYQATEQGAPSNQSVSDLQKAVDQNKKEGLHDPTMELSLLRQEKALGQVSDAKYEKQMEQVMVNAQKQWAQERKAGTLDEDAESRTHWAYYQMEKQLPKATQTRMDNYVEAHRPKN